MFRVAGVIVLLVLVGCTQQTALNNNRADRNESTFCTKDSDCKIVVKGCPICHSCEKYELTDSEIIAVNTAYQCPPKPQGTVCPLCATPYSEAFNPENAACINNTCQKVL